MSVLKNLEPASVMYYFEELCAVPHGSFDTKRISDYCVNFAKAHDLRYVQDEYNNVVIYKPATKGYEDHPTVILQGHLDMVCEKDDDCDIDFSRDGLRLRHDGEFIFAQGTTLGGDDGIAVAYALALLAADDLKHPALECVFTTDEEVGMLGADAMDMSVLEGRLLLNCDSEDEGVLTVSCAGGARSDIELPIAHEAAQGQAYRVAVSDLIGGHSGVEIHKGRANANGKLSPGQGLFSAGRKKTQRHAETERQKDQPTLHFSSPKLISPMAPEIKALLPKRSKRALAPSKSQENFAVGYFFNSSVSSRQIPSALSREQAPTATAAKPFFSPFTTPMISFSSFSASRAKAIFPRALTARTP